MYLHLGNDVIIRKAEVLGIFDLDNTSQSRLTRAFLAEAERSGAVINAAGEGLPKSFLVCQTETGQRVYLSQLNSSTLMKRSESSGIESPMNLGSAD